MVEEDKLKRLLQAEEARKKNFSEIKVTKKLQEVPLPTPELFVDSVNIMGKMQIFRNPNEIRFKRVHRISPSPGVMEPIAELDVEPIVERKRFYPLSRFKGVKLENMNKTAKFLMSQDVQTVDSPTHSPISSTRRKSSVIKEQALQKELTIKVISKHDSSVSLERMMPLIDKDRRAVSKSLVLVPGESRRTLSLYEI